MATQFELLNQALSILAARVAALEQPLPSGYDPDTQIGWRENADGTLEQWGYLNHGQIINAGVSTHVDLILPMIYADARYTTLLQIHVVTADGVSGNMAAWINEQTNSGFQAQFDASNTDTQYQIRVMFHTIGKKPSSANQTQD